MSDTPRTNLEAFFPHESMYQVCDADFCRQLERELNAANQNVRQLENAMDEIKSCLETWDVFVRQIQSEINAANERIKRLEEAGDELAGKHLFAVHTYDNAKKHVAEWYKAKEAKP